MGLSNAPLKTTQMYAMGSPLKAWIKQDSTIYTLATCDITNKIKKSSIIRISGLMSYPLTSIAGKVMEIRLNGVPVHQVYPAISTKQFGFEVYFFIDGTAKKLVRAQSFIGSGAAAITDGTGNLFGSNTSYLPTTSSITLTGTNDVLTIGSRVQGTASSDGEYHILEGFVVEMLNTPSPTSYNSDSIACWGDSLTAGSGATAGNDYPSQLGKLRIAKPFYNGGVGGETASQILTRILDDDLKGKVDTVVLWMGRNNVGTGTMQADVLSALASAVANLNHSRYVIMTVLNATTEANGSANKTALDALNAAIASTYSATNVLDIVATICTEPNGTPNPAYMSDTVHLNNTGYAAVASAVDAKLTANGW